MRHPGFSLLACLSLIALLPGCASRSDSLTPLFNDPLAHHGEVLNVRVYPYDTGDRNYLFCTRPCPNPPMSPLGNNWVVPLDRDAFAGWKGARSVRLRARVDTSSFDPASFWGHFPIFLKEVPSEDATR